MHAFFLVPIKFSFVINEKTVDKQMVLLIGDLILPTLTANSLQLQFLLQRLYLQPEILKRCQEEIDRVVGDSRLPTLNDRVK